MSTSLCKVSCQALVESPSLQSICFVDYVSVSKYHCLPKLKIVQTSRLLHSASANSCVNELWIKKRGRLHGFKL